MNSLSPMANQQLAADIFNNLDVRQSTITDYKYRIGNFLQYVVDNGMNGDVLLNYKRYLANLGSYSVSTKNKYLICAKIFVRECYRRGLLPVDLSVNVKTFSQSKKHKTFGLDEHDIQQVCTWIRSNTMKKRERAMLALLLFQGLRQCEICRLQICDIKLNEGVFFVHGKGRDDKEAVFIHPNTHKLLNEYLRSLPIDLKTGNAYLFQSLRQQSSSTQLTERGLRKIIEGILHDIGVYKNVHGFRHYFTSQLIRTMPGELTNVAAFTRHRSLGQLQVYNDNIIQHQQLSKYVSAFEALAV